MTEEKKNIITIFSCIALIFVVVFTAITIGLIDKAEQKKYISRHKYFVTVPNGKYSHTYYTNEYKEENGILYFIVDGKKIRHKGEYTLGEVSK